MELEPSETDFEPVSDKRPRLWPPPAVQIVAIADVSLHALKTLEKLLDPFYVGLLGFERDPNETVSGSRIVYRAENARLRLILHRHSPGVEFRPVMVVVPSLAELTRKMTEAEIKYEIQNGLMPGSECVGVRDPAGNYVQIFQAVEFS